MSRRWWMWAGLLCLPFLGIWSCESGMGSGFRVGAPLSAYNLDPTQTPVSHPRNYYHWDIRERQGFSEYCREHSIDIAHFTGSIVLSRPGESIDGWELAIVDGKFSYYGENPDPWYTEDVARLRTSTAREMMAQTRNDWRIYNANNHFVDPDKPFTGDILIRPDSWIGMCIELKVQKDVIRSVRRTVYLTLD